jgi:hypothetical protein
MAKLTKTTKQVPKTVMEDVETFTLELERDEAETLFRLVYFHITGPDNGPRGKLDQICFALQEEITGNDDRLNIRGPEHLFIEED